MNIIHFNIMIVYTIMPCTFISYKKPPSSGSNDPMPRLQIGSGTSILERQPLYGLYDYSQGGMIYLAEELFAEGANRSEELV